jgi:CHASE3 domain sensor protein
MTFKEQIKTSSQMDQSFLLENFNKESLFQSYEDQLNETHKFVRKNESLEEENKRLKLHIERLEVSMLIHKIN